MGMKRTRQIILSGGKWLGSGTQWKLMTTKASNRAAVHGVKQPVPDIVDKEKVEKDIRKAKEEKEAKRKEIEKAVESQINNSFKSD